MTLSGTEQSEYTGKPGNLSRQSTDQFSEADMITEEELEQRITRMIEQQEQDELEQYKKTRQESEGQPDDNNVSGL